MKKVLTSIILLFVLQLNAQVSISKEQWQQDLLFLKTTIQNDYPFLYKKVTKEEFHVALHKFYQEIPSLEEHEIVVGFNKLISLFEYGHTLVSFHQEPFAFSEFPFNLYQFKDGIYIEGTHRDYKVALGAKLIAVEGIPISKVLEMIKPTVEAENSQYFKAYGINNIRHPEVLHTQRITSKLQSSLRLTLEKDGQRFDQTFHLLADKEAVPTKYGFTPNHKNWLSARKQDKTPLYLKNFDKIYYYEYLAEEKSVYVRHSRVRDDLSESTDAFYKRVFEFIENSDVEKLILDLRLNGGGNNYLVKPIITGIIETEKIN